SLISPGRRIVSVGIDLCALKLGWAGGWETRSAGASGACEIYHKLLFGAIMGLLEKAGHF
ncbi:MAG TPA: hypothetical protein VEK37_13305, partial [Gemmatimonadaceae bacterium]|nr:hypothetical protein [Gemmatimonadaceae bacterium]